MTEKLYYNRPDCTEWETTVTGVTQRENYYLVTLKETAFYPEGGGQPADHGYINSIEVSDVFEEDDIVYHKLLSPIETEKVECSINWERRLDHTQQHTGQHLLSAVCIELFDYQTISFHLGIETVTIDLDLKDITDDHLEQIETEVNQYIFENRQIKTYFVSEEELSSLNLRKTPDVSENIRIVEIDGIDISACCGTHLKSTGQLGIIKLLKTEKQKGKIRLHFKCGMRALKDYQISSDIITKLSNQLSSNREDVIDKITKLEHENKKIQKELIVLKSENDIYIANDLLNQHKDEQVIKHLFPQATIKDLQGIARTITEEADKLLIFSTPLEHKVYLAHNGIFDVHCGQIFKEYLKSFNGKGGGNATSAQAAFTSSDDLEKFVNYLYEKLTLVPKEIQESN